MIARPFHLRSSALCALLVLAACGGGSTLRQGASIDDVASPPRLINGDEVEAAIEAAYPPQLRDAGIGGVVRLSLLVGRDGVPIDSRLLRTSGSADLDRAARRVIPVLRFSPALNRGGEPLEVWASFPIVFGGS
ncbi:MAG: energy transducer TonB [Gemmatimonadota bacterium]